MYPVTVCNVHMMLVLSLHEYGAHTTMIPSSRVQVKMHSPLMTCNVDDDYPQFMDATLSFCPICSLCRPLRKGAKKFDMHSRIVSNATLRIKVIDLGFKVINKFNS